MEKLVIMDGHSILNRAFYGLPDLTNSEGKHTNAVYGFLNIMLKVLEEEKPDRFAVAFDVSAPTFRHLRYQAYKGTRKPMPSELAEQVPLLKKVLAAMQIRMFEHPGYEADDILGTLARQGEALGMEVSVISGDRDLLQLATDRILIRIPKTKQGSTEIENYHAADVFDRYGITPLQFIDLKGLMGDASDNIPGIPGVGEKTAVKILTAFGSVENAYAHLDEVQPARARISLAENYDQALLSKELATIKTDCVLPAGPEELCMGDFYNETSFAMFKRLEFKNLLSRFGTGVQAATAEEEKLVVLSAGEALSRLPLPSEVSQKKQTMLGLSFYRSGKTLHSAAFFDGTTACFRRFDTKEEADVFCRRLRALSDAGVCLSFLHVKEVLSLLDPDGTGFPEGADAAFFDCALAAYLLNPLKSDYPAEDLANAYLGRPIRSYAELFGKKKPEEAAEEDTFRLYLSGGARAVYRLKEPLSAELEKENMADLFTRIEMPLIFTLYRMERAGIRVDPSALTEFSSELAAHINSCEQEILQMAGESFNINSPKQLGVILFEKLHLPFGKKTKTGYSTSADILEKLQCEDPIVGKILDYRQYSKLKSTYADGLQTFIDPADSRIHGTFNQTITATGRLSSTEPNLQNIPVREELGRQIRKVFLPNPGCIFVDADYSQIELRILAHMSGDEHLITAYREARDIHAMTASQVFHVPLSMVTPEMRRNAKAVNFGIIYGISSFGLGQGLNITRKEAERYIDSYFETYPQVKQFLDNLVAFAKENGYVESMYHRRRPIPELSSSNFMQRSFGERVAMNSPIQGTAADIMKLAMLAVDRRLTAEHRKSRILLQVHDELLVEAPLDEAETVKQILTEEMEGAANLKVPLLVSVSSGSNWYEAK